jgi:hypothetical protein
MYVCIYPFCKSASPRFLNNTIKEKGVKGPAMVVHAYNSSYLEGRNQGDCGLRPAWRKS